MGLVLLAVLGIAWEPLGRSAPPSVALTSGSPPAGGLRGLGRRRINKPAGGRLILLGLWPHRLSAAAGNSRCDQRLRGRPLGRPGGEQASSISSRQTARAPLWEDRQRPRPVSRWAALLSLWTERSFIGGLDSDTLIEHSTICLREGQLAGRPISAWTDEALADYCKRYNVGWIAAWTPQTIERLVRWEGVDKVVALNDDGYGWLFAVKEAGGFALKGKAELTQADSQRITLSGLEPEDGVVVLSLHYQRGMCAAPSRVRVEQEKSGHDPVGFVRLRMAGPVARLTLTWER